MSADTFQKVREVIKEQNYVSNMGGRLLANYGSKIIGVIMTYERRNEVNVAQSPFYSEILGALENEIRKKEYYMMFYTSGGVEESIQMALSWNVEGLIVLGCLPCDCKKLRDRLDKPIVFINSYFEDDSDNYDNVGLRDFEGGYLMTSYLIRMGYKKIAFLADAENPIGVDYECMMGYQEALKENGLEISSSDYILLSYKQGERARQMREFCKKRIQDYSALFFASDFYAMDAVNIFFAEGLKVPDDISVAGFDDNIFAVECRPKLTTVKQSISDKAYCAVDKLMNIIKGRHEEKRNICLPVKLVIRESVKKILK